MDDARVSEDVSAAPAEGAVQVEAEVEVAEVEPRAAGDAGGGARRGRKRRRRDEPPAGEGAAEDASGDEVPAQEPSAEASDAPEPDPAPEPAPELTDEELERAAAALLFASPEPLTVARLAALLGGAPRARVQDALDALDRRLETAGLPWRVVGLAGGWRILTAPDAAEIVQRLQKERKAERVSGAALETLAIVAYRQPVTRAEIEAIRGVQAGPVLRHLVERRLIRIAGRADVPGAPLTYETTKDFLDRFGLASLEDLPKDGELGK